MNSHNAVAPIADGLAPAVFLSPGRQDPSLGRFAIFSAGAAPCLAYGIVIAASPAIVANGVTLAPTILDLELRCQ
jgi:hypothetical protein